MTHYLRDRFGRDIVDIEATEDDIRCVIDIEWFCHLLFYIPAQQRSELIVEFKAIQEIRGTWHEWVGEGRPATTDEFARDWLKETADKWELQYITD